jgi:hypothetical protein
VWDARRSTCLIFWKRVPTVEEITGALIRVPRSANRSVGRSKNLSSVPRKLYQYQEQQNLHRQHHHSQHHS